MAAQLLLVHSPLVGPASWDLVAADLAGRGYEVSVPDLTGTLAAGPPYCSRQAEVIARGARGRPAILIGHSGAGPLLAAAGAMASTMAGAATSAMAGAASSAATRAVQGYVFVDAGLPIPGKTWMGTVPPELAVQVREMADDHGWLAPWPRWWGEEALAGLIPDPGTRRRFADGCPPLPLAMFEEVHPPAPRWPDAPAAYLLLSEAYQDQAARARELGWPVTEQASHHLALVTDPGLVAGWLRDLLGRLLPRVMAPDRTCGVGERHAAFH